MIKFTVDQHIGSGKTIKVTHYLVKSQLQEFVIEHRHDHCSLYIREIGAEDAWCLGDFTSLEICEAIVRNSKHYLDLNGILDIDKVIVQVLGDELM